MKKTLLHGVGSVVAMATLFLFFQNCSNGFSTSPLSPSSENTNNNGAGTNPPISSTGGCLTSSGVAANFSCSMYFNQRVDSITLTQAQRNYSDHIINGLAARGGWGNSNIFQIDFSIDVLNVPNNNTRFFSVATDQDWTDSDPVTSVPAPPLNSTAGFESSSGLTCDGGDCHYLALDKANRKLYEVYQADIRGTVLGHAGYGGIAVWPFDKVWTDALRGDVCTSADAGGLSIGAMLFSAEEIQAGNINHAIRFILPNNRIAYRTYVRPATHTTGGSGWAAAPTTNLTEAPLADSSLEPGLPYGTRLRLKASYDISSLSTGAQVVARALKKYGMILADGGNIALTAQSDNFSRVKYSNLNLSARSLAGLKATDFEVVPPPLPSDLATNTSSQPTLLGPMIKVKYLDCEPKF
jgi:hypothetical protein